MMQHNRVQEVHGMIEDFFCREQRHTETIARA